MEQILYSPITIGTLNIVNRFVRSATHAFMSDDTGTLSEPEIALYERLARHGMGLIITGHAYVRIDGKASVGMIGLDSDEKIQPFAKAVKRVHAAGPSKLIVQINHSGAQANLPEQERPSSLVSPSLREDVPEARPFSEEEAEELIDCYVSAAIRAKEAGLDGVQLHVAHGYFLNQTLSPKTNKRSDRFGGSIEGRTEMLRRIILGIRENVGAEFPLLMKLACKDGTPDGLSLEDSLAAAAIAETTGIDAVEISGGMRPGFNMRRPKTIDDEGFFSEEAKAFKDRLSIPVLSVHGYRTLSKMEEILASDKGDMVSLCRPLIREPDLIKQFQSGEKTAADCISCNLCVKKRKPLRCWQLQDEAT